MRALLTLFRLILIAGFVSGALFLHRRADGLFGTPGADVAACAYLGAATLSWLLAGWAIRSLFLSMAAADDATENEADEANRLHGPLFRESLPFWKRRPQLTAILAFLVCAVIASGFCLLCLHCCLERQLLSAIENPGESVLRAKTYWKWGEVVSGGLALVVGMAGIGVPIGVLVEASW